MAKETSAKALAEILMNGKKSVKQAAKAAAKLINKTSFDINSLDQDTGMGVLHYLCEAQANPELIYFFLDQLNASPNIKTSPPEGHFELPCAGSTPLHYIAHNASYNYYAHFNTEYATLSTAILTAYGANLNIVNKEGSTPLDHYFDQTNYIISQTPRINDSNDAKKKLIGGTAPFLQVLNALGAEFNALRGSNYQYIIANLEPHINEAVKTLYPKEYKEEHAIVLRPLGTQLRHNALLAPAQIHNAKDDLWLEVFEMGALRAGARRAANTNPEEFGQYTALYNSLDPELCELTIAIKEYLPDEIKIYIAKFLDNIMPQLQATTIITEILEEKEQQHGLSSSSSKQMVLYPNIRQSWQARLNPEENALERTKEAKGTGCSIM